MGSPPVLKSRSFYFSHKLKEVQGSSWDVKPVNKQIILNWLNERIKQASLKRKDNKWRLRAHRWSPSAQHTTWSPTPSVWVC